MTTHTDLRTLLSWGACTDRGLRRRLNEDSFLADTSIFVVADGMGGHAAGDLASAAAVEALRGLASSDVVEVEAVQEALTAAQAGVRQIDGGERGAGTTLAGVVAVEQDGTPYWLVVNVGDSRTYQLSGGHLEQVSVDHSEVQELVDTGAITRAEAATHPRRHVVTRAFGSEPAPRADLWFVPRVAGDRLLVCSDGLTTELADETIAEVLLAHPSPQEAAERLVRCAVDTGGRDNVTAVVVDVAGGDEPEDDRTAPRDHRPATPDESTVPRQLEGER